MSTSWAGMCCDNLAETSLAYIETSRACRSTTGRRMQSELRCRHKAAQERKSRILASGLEVY